MLPRGVFVVKNLSHHLLWFFSTVGMNICWGAYIVSLYSKILKVAEGGIAVCSSGSNYEENGHIPAVLILFLR